MKLSAIITAALSFRESGYLEFLAYKSIDRATLHVQRHSEKSHGESSSVQNHTGDATLAVERSGSISAPTSPSGSPDKVGLQDAALNNCNRPQSWRDVIVGIEECNVCLSQEMLRSHPRLQSASPLSSLAPAEKELQRFMTRPRVSSGDGLEEAAHISTQSPHS